MPAAGAGAVGAGGGGGRLGSAGRRMDLRKSGGDGDSGVRPAASGSGARRWRRPASTATTAAGPGTRWASPGARRSVVGKGATRGGRRRSCGRVGATRCTYVRRYPPRRRPAPSFRDTKQLGVFCPLMPGFPAPPRPRCGRGGARGAPNGAKTPPTSTFRAPRGRRARRGRPQNGHRPPKAHPIGRWGPRRQRPGATSDTSPPPVPDPARRRVVRAPATAPPRGLRPARSRPQHGDTTPAHRRRYVRYAGPSGGDRELIAEECAFLRP
ncbi:hypothetical protein EKD16_10760 [Streptomonospora litoralis]|uniref:Uncharacterized protein n=1 Tax=Streptomonospora litoralis TaxID=2498135 RepID=A0A4P6Q085_9ACTN|nr:hypothetical protein EKD16_10760 [Streptomonospora litoralis]